MVVAPAVPRAGEWAVTDRAGQSHHARPGEEVDVVVIPCRVGDLVVAERPRVEHQTAMHAAATA